MFARGKEIGHGFALRGRTLTGHLEQVAGQHSSPLRAARLIAEHGARLDPTLERLLINQLEGGLTPDPETVREEFTALLMAANPAGGFGVLKALGALVVYLPELEAGRELEQFGGFHHLDVLEHSIEALRRLVATFPDAPLETRWAALLHDVGKPASKSWDVVRERWSFFGHDQVGARLTRDILSRLEYPVDIIERASLIVDRHMLRLPGDPVSALRFARRNARILPDLLAVMLADREAARGPLSNEATRRAYQRGMDFVLQALRDLEMVRPLLDGHEIMAHLGLQPGPLVGEASAVLRAATESGEVGDANEARALLSRWAEAQGLEVSAGDPEEKSSF